MKNRFITILVGLFIAAFLFTGIGMLVWGIMHTQTALSSPSWPTVTGSVIRSEVTTDIDEQMGTMYNAEVVFSYRVGERDLTSGEVSMGDYSSADAERVQKIIAQYPVGQRVRVYYDPVHPEIAVLEPGFNPGLWIPLGLGTAFTLIGITLSFWFSQTLIHRQL